MSSSGGETHQNSHGLAPAVCGAKDVWPPAKTPQAYLSRLACVKARFRCEAKFGAQGGQNGTLRSQNKESNDKDNAQLCSHK